VNTFSGHNQMSIACPQCGSRRSNVVLNRSQSGSIYRRRKCLSCKTIYTTQEQYVVGSMRDAIASALSEKDNP